VRSIKTVWPVATAKIVKLRLVNLEPLSMEADLATRVTDVHYVKVNGRDVDAFVLMPSRATIRFTIPSDFSVEKLEIQCRPEDLDGARAQLELKNSDAVHGAEKLLQMIVRLFHTSPGSILGHPDVWGKPDLRGVPEEQRTTALGATVYRIQQYILKYQSNKPNLPDSGKLHSIELISLQNTSAGMPRVNIRIITAAGSIMHTLAWSGADV